MSEMEQDTTEDVTGNGGPKGRSSLDGLVGRVRELEIDHDPEGWPAVQMRILTDMADRIESLESALGGIIKAWDQSAWRAWPSIVMIERPVEAARTVLSSNAAHEARSGEPTNAKGNQ